MFVDQKSERVVVPLNATLESEGRLELANSVSPSHVYDWRRLNIFQQVR